MSNLMSEQGKVECRIDGCDKKINLSGLTVREIKEKLKDNGWTAVYPTTACPEHYYKNYKE